jgi:hypothetical protein
VISKPIKLSASVAINFCTQLLFRWLKYFESSVLPKVFLASLRRKCLKFVQSPVSSVFYLHHRSKANPNRTKSRKIKTALQLCVLHTYVRKRVLDCINTTKVGRLTFHKLKQWIIKIFLAGKRKCHRWSKRQIFGKWWIRFCDCWLLRRWRDYVGELQRKNNRIYFNYRIRCRN